jgi:hypothetical protein
LPLVAPKTVTAISSSSAVPVTVKAAPAALTFTTSTPVNDTGFTSVTVEVP